MLYFVRHGQSQASLDNVFAGPTYPSPLTPAGIMQAKALAQQILAKHIQIDQIVCSPLERTRHTAQIIASGIGVNPKAIQIDARLTEYNMGKLSGQSIGDEPPTRALTAPGAEGAQAFYKRVKAALDDAKRLPGNTLIVSHGGIGRMIMVIQKELAPSRLYELEGYPDDKVVSLEF